ncbi:MAG: BrnT family toxin [Anaerolineae bacterium]|nr:BrnT family toxin [Anaerolineae bacterium]
MLDLKSLDGFDWDEGNQTKNRDRHHVSIVECEEAFFNTPLLLREDTRHSTHELRYYVLGQTNTGRPLFIAFTVRGTKIRVISARQMNRKERYLYDQTTP